MTTGAKGFMNREARGAGADFMPLQSVAFGPFEITANATLDALTYSGRCGFFNVAAGAVITLPQATGSGAKYRFMVKTTITSNSAKIQVGNTDDAFRGVIYSTLVGTPTTNNGWPATAASNYDTVTMNGTTTGGIAGDYVEFEDIAVGIYLVQGTIQQSGTAATPFSAAV